MATPQYDALKVKVRDWANKREVATVPEDIIEDCLQYGADDIYRDLRIPQLEYTIRYVVDATANGIEEKYTVLEVPDDLTEFVYLRKLKDTQETDEMYNQVTDIRTFLDPGAEHYGRFRYIWKDLQMFIHPKLEIGDTVELNYYRRLPQLNALYSVIPANWDSLYADDGQPYLTLVISGGTSLWKSGDSPNVAVFSTEAEADAWAVVNGGTTTEIRYEGKESWNWLRDANERALIFGALKHIGAYLDNDKMEARYDTKMKETITKLNTEERFRRARGGNVQVNVNTGGMI